MSIGKIGKIVKVGKRVITLGLISLVGLVGLVGQNSFAMDLSYTYDIEMDVCDKIENYKGKISQQDMDYPKFVGKFESRPNEIVLMTNDAKMYVFMETEQDCINYRKHFQEDISKEDVLKYDLFGEE